MDAYELPDGRLVVPKRAEGGGGVLGDGMIEVGPGDADYEAWRAYFASSGEAPPKIEKWPPEPE